MIRKMPSQHEGYGALLPRADADSGSLDVADEFLVQTIIRSLVGFAVGKYGQRHRAGIAIRRPMPRLEILSGLNFVGQGDMVHVDVAPTPGGIVDDLNFGFL